VIIIETVGVGQSETAVAGMADVFCLLLLPNAGDELQAIKKGIVELADVLVINKADIDPRATALAYSQLKNAVGLLRPTSPNWQPPIVTTSALNQDGLDNFWGAIERYRATMEQSGEFTDKRRGQSLAWMWEMIDRGLRHRFRDHPHVKRDLAQMSRDVEEGVATPASAADRLLGYL
jgi:LAO/AO transport system kinase